jgi:hypothetical protein
MAPPVFIPLPFLEITAFECISDDPIDLVKAIKSAATNFNKAHKDSNSKFDNAMKGAKLFMRWLYAVHKDLVEETRLSIEPDNVELLAYAEDLTFQVHPPFARKNLLIPPRHQREQ